MSETAGPAESRPIVLVMWVDSGFSYSQGWDDQHGLIERAQAWDGFVTTVGYLMYEDDRCVVLAQSRDGGTDTSPGEPRWASMMLINRANILKMEPLIPMSASPTDSPPASAPATSTQENPATQAVRLSEPKHLPSENLWWCLTHGAFEEGAVYQEDHDGRYRAEQPAPGPQDGPEPDHTDLIR